jgi:hypothetical protein
MKKWLLSIVLTTLSYTATFSLTPEAEQALFDTASLLAYDLANHDSSAVTLTVTDPERMSWSGSYDCVLVLTWERMPFRQQNQFHYYPLRSYLDEYAVLHTDLDSNDSDIVRRIGFGDTYGVTQFRVRDIIGVSEFQLGPNTTQRTVSFQEKYAYSLDISAEITPELHSFINEWHEIASSVRRGDAFFGTDAAKNVVNWTCAIGGALIASVGVSGLAVDAPWESPGATAGALIGGGVVLASIPFFSQARIKKSAVERFQALIDGFPDTHSRILTIE